LERLVPSSSLRDRSRLVFERTHALTAGGRRLTAEELRSQFERRSYGRLGKIASPTLFVCGDDDPVVPLADGVMLAHDIPNGRLHVSVEDGRLLLLDSSTAPQAVADFLATDELEARRLLAVARTIRARRSVTRRSRGRRTCSIRTGC
jgi:pimeloyl-ACP methyl ester carboxylesterase